MRGWENDLNDADDGGRKGDSVESNSSGCSERSHVSIEIGTSQAWSSK